MYQCTFISHRLHLPMHPYCSGLKSALTPLDTVNNVEKAVCTDEVLLCSRHKENADAFPQALIPVASDTCASGLVQKLKQEPAFWIHLQSLQGIEHYYSHY